MYFLICWGYFISKIALLQYVICISKVLRGQEKYIRKKFPQLSINKEEHWLYIAKSTTNPGSAVEYEDGFWEIKAKAQKSLQK